MKEGQRKERKRKRMKWNTIYLALDTIQAFLKWYGYCQLQNPNDSHGRLFPHSTIKLEPEWTVGKFGR